MTISYLPPPTSGIKDPGDLSTELKQNLSPSTVDTTRLEDSEFVGFRLTAPSGKVIRVWAAGAINVSGNSPADLKAEVGGTVVANGSGREIGDPLYESAAGATELLATRNDTGGQQDASSYFAVTIENA